MFIIYLKLNGDYNVLINFDVHKTPQIFINSSSRLKNLVQQIHQVDGRYSFKSSVIEKIIRVS